MHLDNLENYSDYAYKFIRTICEKFGPRYSSSTEEREANKWIKSDWSKFCDETKLEEFATYPDLYPQGIFKI